MRQTLDALKDAGFHWATRSGVTIAIDDVVVPPRKAEILDQYERPPSRSTSGTSAVCSPTRSADELVESGPRPPSEVAKAMEDNFPQTNPVYTIVTSGAPAT